MNRKLETIIHAMKPDNIISFDTFGKNWQGAFDNASWITGTVGAKCKQIKFSVGCILNVSHPVQIFVLENRHGDHIYSIRSETTLSFFAFIPVRGMLTYATQGCQIQF